MVIVVDGEVVVGPVVVLVEVVAVVEDVGVEVDVDVLEVEGLQLMRTNELTRKIETRINKNLFIFLPPCRFFYLAAYQCVNKLTSILNLFA